MAISNADDRRLLSVYSPRQVEEKWYRVWKENGYFSADRSIKGKPYSIVMPPPNVTGQLHMGHALDNTLQDILIRYYRMKGRQVLWVPGTDHAGIATQAKVEENLAKEGLNRQELGREAFLEKTWEWKDKYHNRIAHQLEMLGCSCDWEKERFTLDEGCSEAVREVFISLYKKGLVYRGSYIVNWCSHCHTTISDIEVEHVQKKGFLWYFRYPLTDKSGFITVATSRPETIPGDTALAVNPADKRYARFIGKTVTLPVFNREIPVIADSYVDMQYGTGAVKITPAHDPNDFEVGQRHNLPHITVIDRDSIMTESAGIFAGLPSKECRELIVKEFIRLNLLDHIEEIEHSVGECYRCGTTVEPLVSPQWFVRMEPLAAPAAEAVRSGKIRFVPDRFAKVYLNWMDSIRDWCISRQLWWGHRIPVWYCDDCDEVICEKNEPERCPACNGTRLTRDPDVLDTWFSSALWPFSTLGWPQNTDLLNKFYPTEVLVTGRDIIFFWVARMIFSGLEFMHDKPFRDVFIHGLVLDAEGRKMSKSYGNGIDPIEIIEKYGADTLRFMLVTGNAPGNDLRFQEERLEATRNFVNKIWNACRFALMHMDEDIHVRFTVELSLVDKWIIDCMGRTVVEVNRLMGNYELGEAARAIYDFIWDDVCDWYIETAKVRLKDGSPEECYTVRHVLFKVMRTSLEMLHPFMPFVTEELWQRFPECTETIMLTDYPENTAFFEAETVKMSLIKAIIGAIRNIRAEMNILPSKQIEVFFVCQEENQSIIQEGLSYIANLAKAAKISFIEDGTTFGQAVSAHVEGVNIFIPMKDLVDYQKEIERLQKEILLCEKELSRVAQRLDNTGFIAKAPKEVIDKEMEKRDAYRLKKADLEKRLTFFLT